MRFTLLGFDEDTDIEEPNAISSPGPHSSPSSYCQVHTSEGIQFGNLPELSEVDPDSDYFSDPQTPIKRATGLTDTQKTRRTLDFMRDFNRFSLQIFLKTLFESDDPSIKNFSNTFLAGKGVLSVMELLWKGGAGLNNPDLMAWMVEKAASACAQEAGWLSNCASEGPHPNEAQFLRVSSRDVNVKMVNDFRIHDLGVLYEHLTPNLQVILKAIIAKDKKKMEPGSHDLDLVLESIFHSRTCLILMSNKGQNFNYIHPAQFTKPQGKLPCCFEFAVVLGQLCTKAPCTGA